MMITSPHIRKRVGKRVRGTGTLTQHWVKVPVPLTRCVTFTRSGNFLWAELYHAVTDNAGSYVHLVNSVTGNADFSWGRKSKI